MICKTRHIFQLLNRIGYSNWRSANAICEIISAMPNRKKERIHFNFCLTVLHILGKTLNIPIYLVAKDFLYKVKN